MDYTVILRIVVVSPPAGYIFFLEDDKGNPNSITESTGEDITFDFDAIAKENRRIGAPNFTGPFARGTPSKRFFYINIGEAGQENPSWDRRAKIWISDVSWSTIKKVASDPNKVLMARYMGTSEHGGPNCATCELLDDGRGVAPR